MTVLAEIKSILMDLKDLKSLRLLSNRDEHKAKACHEPYLNHLKFSREVRYQESVCLIRPLMEIDSINELLRN
jgi:hypothetical protein